MKSYSGTPATPTVWYCYDGDTANHTSPEPARDCTGAPGGSNLGGRLTMVKSSASETAYQSYDAHGRVLTHRQKTNGVEYPFSYQYNLADQVTNLTYPSGREVVTSYTANGRIAGVPGYATVNTREPFGGITGFTLGNGLVEASTYDKPRNRLLTVAIGTSPSTKFGLTYTYTANSNVNSQRIKFDLPAAFDATQNYIYDPLNRLQTMSEGSPAVVAQTYVYDRLGNRAQLNGAGQYIPASSLTPQVSTNSELAVMTLFPSNRWAFAGVDYDLAGNVTALPLRGMVYDGENRQVSSSETVNGTTTTTTYAYDGDGRRVRKNNTYYVYDAFGNLAAEYGSSPQTTGRQYVTVDALGSTRLLTDASGGVVKRYDYLPFGEDLIAGVHGRTAPMGYQAAMDDVNPKFTGKERDAETGLDYFEARYFSSAQGRFTSPDPYNIIAEAENRDQFNAYISQPQNWNRYSYVWNNPLRHVDPTGETVYVIAYTYSNEHGDEEIKRAAETRANEIRNSKGFNSKTDTVLVGGVNSLAGFKDLVGKANGLEKQFGKVGELDLFSHAGAKDGPNFQEGLNGNRVPRPWSNEQNRSGVLGLNVNWAPNAQAGFYGCNTANPYTDFAQAFANKQNVPTYGINTDASFSVFKDWGTIGHALFRFGVNTQNLYMVPQARRDPQPKPKF
ncbi:MAG: hypothetical protein NTY38_09510 [Acidobacteria bacterium]|nr:hypothetical protein [Acidobacteriota bacterium]